MSLIGDDCRFFMNNECVRGNLCSFRHQPGARDTETICPEWIKGACFKPTCVLRHMIDPDRTKVPCYWETQPSGCLKASCPFLHTKAKTSIPIQPNVTLPVTPVVSNHVMINSIQPRIETAPLPNILPKVEKHFPPTIIHNGNVPMQGVKFIPSQFHHPMIGTGGPPLGPQIQLQNHRLVIQQAVIRPNTNVVHQQAGLPQNGVAGGSVSTFPKSEHFSKQVEMFKQMLAKKNAVSNDEDVEFSDGYESSGRNRRKERHRHKSRKHKDVHPTSKKAKKERNSLSRGDKEILYGDYKDVTLEKRSRTNEVAAVAAPVVDSQIKVKPYDEILREKALKKVMEKRRAKFDNDFKELVGEKMKKKSRKAIDGETTGIVNSSVDDICLEDFSKEDALELDASPIRDDDDFSSPSTPVKKTKSHTKIKDTFKKKSLSENVDEEENVSCENHEDDDDIEQERDDDNVNAIHMEESGNEKIIEVITDETIDFDVDANDDLAVELQTMHKTTKGKHRRGSSNKKSMSSVVVTKSRPSKLSRSEKRKVSVSAEKLLTENKKKNETTKPAKKESKIDKESNRNKASVVVIGSPKRENKKSSVVVSEVKIKSFEEIMAEKRKRKATTNGGELDNVVDNLKEKTKQVRNDLLGETTVHSKTIVRSSVKLPEKSSTKTVMKRQDSSEEAKAKRQSMQLYKPPFNPEGKIEMVETKTVVDTGARKIIRIKKSIPPIAATKISSTPSETSSSNNDDCSKSSVKTFEEIMREKKSRRKEKFEPEPIDDKQKLGAKLVPHRFLKKHVAVKADVNSAEKPKPKIKVRPIVSAHHNLAVTNKKPVHSEAVTARVPPLHVNNIAHNGDTSNIEKSTIPNEINKTTEEKENKVISNERATSSDDSSISHAVAIENIQEALNEKKRLRETEILSDDEFEKEINDIIDGETSDGGGDIDDDDLMMEIEEMIGSSS